MIQGLAASVALIAAACTSSPTPTESAPVLSPTAAASLPQTPQPTVTAAPSIAPTASPVLPSGQLLYLAAGAAWLVPASGGTAVRLGSAVTASWSADGNHIHLVSLGSTCVPRLTTLTSSGQVVTVVKRGLRAGDSAFAWSPDDRKIVFARYRKGQPAGVCGATDPYAGNRAVKDVLELSADGSGLRTVSAGVWPYGPIAWARDGARIAFAADVPPRLDKQDVCIVRVRDGNLRHINSDPFGGVSGPRWSPDQRYLGVTLYARGTLDVLRADTGLVRRLGNVTIHQQPSWSPDGTWLEAITGAPSGSAGALIELWPLDGSEPRDLGVTDAMANPLLPPSWSPDGRWLAYVGVPTAGGPGAVLVIAIDGSATQLVPGSDGAVGLAWQPGS